MTFEASILVVLPTYNERLNLTSVVEGIRQQGCDVLVVDDNSPDGTGALADEMAARDFHVRVLHRSGKLGLGSAYVAGFANGLEYDYDFFVGMDADLSHKPAYLGSIIAASDSAGGLAIGSRYVPGGSIAGWPRRRLLLSRSANIFCRGVLGIRVSDCTSGYRCYPREVIERIDFGTIVADGYGFLIELLYRCLQLGVPVVEVPIRFEDRVAGKSKVSQAEIRKALALVPRLRWNRAIGRTGRRPRRSPVTGVELIGVGHGGAAPLRAAPNENVKGDTIPR